MTDVDFYSESFIYHHRRQHNNDRLGMMPQDREAERDQLEYVPSFWSDFDEFSAEEEQHESPKSIDETDNDGFTANIRIMSLDCHLDGCAQVCPDLSALRLHLWKRHGQKQFVCLFCLKPAKSYRTRSKLARHVRKRHSAQYQSGEFTCKICGQTYGDYHGLRRHFHLNHRTGRFACVACDFISNTTRMTVMRHYDKEHGTNLKQNSAKILNLHYQNVHTEHHRSQSRPKSRANLVAPPVVPKPPRAKVIKPIDEQQPSPPIRAKVIKRSFRCHIGKCESVFKELIKLENHLWEKHQTRPTVCLLPGCVESFDNAAQLRSHLDRSHSAASASNHYPCCRCPASFINYSKLGIHFRDAHRTGTFGCSVCEFVTDSEAKAWQHVEHGHSMEPNPRLNPPASATNLFGEPNHSNRIPSSPATNSQSTPPIVTILQHKCFIDTCRSSSTISYSSLTDLESHLTLQHQIRPAFCIVRDCGASFDQAAQLESHIKDAHSRNVETKQFTCFLCTRELDEYGRLRRHFVDVHQSCLWGCSGCDFAGHRLDAILHVTKDHSRRSVSVEDEESVVENQPEVEVHNEENEPEPVEGQEAELMIPKPKAKARVITVQLRCLLEDCDTWFDTKVRYIDHLNRAHYIKPNVCWTRDCMRSFDTRGKLNRHLKADHQGKDLRCLMCEKRYSSYEKLLRHFRECHERGHFACSVCDIESRDDLSRQWMNYHIGQHQCRRRRVKSRCVQADSDYWCRYPGCRFGSRYQQNALIHIRVKHLCLPATNKEMRARDIRPRRDLERRYLGCR